LDSQHSLSLILRIVYDKLYPIVSKIDNNSIIIHLIRDNHSCRSRCLNHGCYVSRSPQGSRFFILLASFLEGLIRDGRSGISLGSAAERERAHNKLVGVWPPQAERDGAIHCTLPMHMRHLLRRWICHTIPALTGSIFVIWLFSSVQAYTSFLAITCRHSLTRRWSVLRTSQNLLLLLSSSSPLTEPLYGGSRVILWTAGAMRCLGLYFPRSTWQIDC